MPEERLSHSNNVASKCCKATDRVNDGGEGEIWQVLQNRIDPDMGELKMNEEGKRAVCPEGRQQ